MVKDLVLNSDLTSYQYCDIIEEWRKDMPFDSTETFYADDGWGSDSIYDYRSSEDTTEDVKEIIERYNDPEQKSNRVCNFSLLIHGDYDCDGITNNTAPCPLESYPGFCWQHACEVVA